MEDIMRLRIGLSGTAVFMVLALSPLTAHAQPAGEDRRSVRIAGGVVSQSGVFGVRAAYGHTFGGKVRIQPEGGVGVAGGVGALPWSPGAKTGVSLPKWWGGDLPAGGEASGSRDDDFEPLTGLRLICDRMVV